MNTGRLPVAAGCLAFAMASLGVAAPVPQTAHREMAMAEGARQSYADVVDRVAPAVVTIHSERRVRAPQQYPFMEDPFFQQFFGNGNPNRSPNRQRGNQDRSTIERALGSGVITTPDGYIVTNHHVIDGADQIKVDLRDGRTFDAKLIGSDPPSDLALLKINATDLPVLPLGDSDRVRVGDVALAVGNPLGIGETVTMGIISAKGRATGLSDGSFEDFLQTDAAINQGNSGGALVNTRGELIGINSQILSPSGGNIGIGFAIPVNMVKNVTQQLRNGGKVHRGKLGVTIQLITPDLATSLNLPNTHGVLVDSVEPNSPAEKAGMKSGDVIVAVNGQRVEDPNELRNRIAQAGPNSEVSMKVLRNGHEEQMQARLTELQPGNNEKGENSETPGSPAGGQLGITVEPLTPDNAADLGLSRTAHGAVVTDVDPSGPAGEAGIQRNDVIMEVNHTPVANGAAIRSALQKSGNRPALLLVNRKGQNVFLAVRPNSK